MSINIAFLYIWWLIICVFCIIYLCVLHLPYNDSSNINRPKYFHVISFLIFYFSGIFSFPLGRVNFWSVSPFLLPTTSSRFISFLLFPCFLASLDLLCIGNIIITNGKKNENADVLKSLLWFLPCSLRSVCILNSWSVYSSSIPKNSMLLYKTQFNIMRKHYTLF